MLAHFYPSSSNTERLPTLLLVCYCHHPRLKGLPQILGIVSECLSYSLLPVPSPHGTKQANRQTKYDVTQYKRRENQLWRQVDLCFNPDCAMP